MRKLRIPYRLLTHLPKTVMDLVQYQKYYKETTFKEKLISVFSGVGTSATQEILSLYYMLKDPSINLSGRDKGLIFAALGYFILPIDIIPDFLFTIVGFTDDVAVIMLVISLLEAKITPEIKYKAHLRTCKLFGCAPTMPHPDEID